MSEREDVRRFDENGNRVGWFENRIDDSPEAKGRALYDLVTDWMQQGEPDAEEVDRNPQATDFFVALGDYALDHVEEHKALPMSFEYAEDGVSLDIKDGGKLFAIMQWAADHDLDPNTNLLDAVDMSREAADDMIGKDDPDRPAGPSI